MSRDDIWNLIARKLSGEASDAESVQLDQLLNEDPSVYYDFRLLEQLWEMGQEKDLDYLEATYYLHYSKMKKLGVEPGNPQNENPEQDFHKPSKKNHSVKVKWAFGLLVIMVVVTFAYFHSATQVKKTSPTLSEVIPSTQSLETKNANKLKTKLPDGSLVWLNSGSKLNYDKMQSGINREVYLVGEGYFEVAKNPKRPFIIHTATIDIKVLGTEFNVKAYPEDATVETSLIRGSVQVFLKNNPAKNYFLKPNEKLVLYKNRSLIKAANQDKNVSFSVPKVTIQNLTYLDGSESVSETAWVNNLLSFRDERFEEVAHKMERWYDVEINFKKEELKNLRLQGTFRNETLKEAMQALQFTFNFNFTINEKNVLIY